MNSRSVGHISRQAQNPLSLPETRPLPHQIRLRRASCGDLPIEPVLVPIERAGLRACVRARSGPMPLPSGIELRRGYFSGGMESYGDRQIL
jgi:hypothetical protein